jgi:hypothetical protein
MLIPALLVAAVFLYGIVHIGLHTLRKKGDRDRAGVFIGVSLMVFVALFGLWVTYFLAFRAN